MLFFFIYVEEREDCSSTNMNGINDMKVIDVEEKAREGSEVTL